MCEYDSDIFNIDICNALHNGLYKFRLDGKYCDVKIQVEGKTFTCHRAILASVCEVFDAMFGENFKESSRDDVVTLVDIIDAVSFQIILEFIYVGLSPILNEDNIYGVLRSSDFLQLKFLKDLCIEYSAQNASYFSSLTVFRLFDLACGMNDQLLIKNLSKLIVWRLKDFVQEDFFVLMEHNCLNLVFQEYRRFSILHFHHSSENFLLDAVLRWVFHSFEERQKFLQEFIEMVDFGKISTQCVEFLLQEYNIDCTKFDALENTAASSKTLTRDVFSSYFKSAKNIDYIPTSFKDPPLAISPSIHMYVELIDEEHKGTLFNVFSLNRDESSGFSSELSIPRMYENQFSWAVSCSFRGGKQKPTFNPILATLNEPNRIYCLRGKEFRAYTSLDLSSGQYTELSCPQRIFTNYFTNACATYNRNIYLCNRMDHDIHNYNCDVDQWFQIPKPQVKTRSSFTTSNNLLYLVDITHPKDTLETLVQVYDDRNSKWIQFKSPFSPRAERSPFSATCVKDRDIHLYNGKSFEVFDTVAIRWRDLEVNNKIIMPSHDKSFYQLQMLHHENKLWLFFPSSKYITYNFETKRLNKSVVFDNSDREKVLVDFYVSNVITCKSD